MPIFMRALMTSLALMAMRWASSLTVIVSPMSTSRTTGAVGFSKICCGSRLTATLRRRCFFFLRRPPMPSATCSVWSPSVGSSTMRSFLFFCRARSASARCCDSFSVCAALRRSSSARCFALLRRPLPPAAAPLRAACSPLPRAVRPRAARVPRPHAPRAPPGPTSLRRCARLPRRDAPRRALPAACAPALRERRA